MMNFSTGPPGQRYLHDRRNFMLYCADRQIVFLGHEEAQKVQIEKTAAGWLTPAADKHNC